MKNKKKSFKKRSNFIFYFICGLLLFAFVISLGSVRPFSNNKDPSSSDTDSPSLTDPPSTVPETPTYNGYIPLGKYVLATDEVTEELYLEPDPYCSEDIPCFKCSVGDLPIYNLINISDYLGFAIGWMTDGSYTSLSVGDTIEVIEQLEVDEYTYDVFMHYFTFVEEIEPDTPETPTTPEYNGYISTGIYTIDLSRDDLMELELNGVNDYFYKYGNDEGGHLCVLINCNLGDATLLDLCLDNDYGYAAWDTPEGTVTIEITRDFECTEEEFNAFMHNFTPVSATDEFVIPTGTRYYHWGEGSYNDFSIEEDEPFFIYEGKNGVGIRNYEDENDVGLTTELIFEDGSTLANIGYEYTIEITREVEVTEEQFYEFNVTFFVEPL